MTACVYCGRAGATLKINQEARAHRPCFVAADLACELRDLELGRVTYAPPELHVELAFLTERPRRDLQGQRFGSLLVLRPTVRFNSAGHASRHWVVECDCGTTFEIQTSHLDKGQRNCRACGIRRMALAKAPRYGGMTVPDLARRAGISQAAVRQRIRLGWAVERLAAPGRSAERSAA